MSSLREQYFMLYGTESPEEKTAQDLDNAMNLKRWGFNENKCLSCGKSNSEVDGLLMQCARCKKAYYCSTKCYNEHLPIHQKVCCLSGNLKQDIQGRLKKKLGGVGNVRVNPPKNPNSQIKSAPMSVASHTIDTSAKLYHAPILDEDGTALCPKQTDNLEANALHDTCDDDDSSETTIEEVVIEYVDVIKKKKKLEQQQAPGKIEMGTEEDDTESNYYYVFELPNEGDGLGNNSVTSILGHPSSNHLLLLVATATPKLQHVLNQQDAFDNLKCNKIRFDVLDSCNSKLKDEVSSLLALSGCSNEFPQFFLRTKDDAFVFWGGWNEYEQVRKEGKLEEAFGNR